MLTLQKTETIQCYQVALALQTKTKQNPFIAVLILAEEKGGVLTAGGLQDALFPTLPERACQNLLERLMQQGFLKKDAYGCYELTPKGRESAKDKSFWVGEKGIYNVFVTNSPLVVQKVIKADKAERTERDNTLSNTPREIQQYQNQVLYLNKKEVLLESIEQKCFKLNDKSCKLEILTKETESTIRITENGQVLYQISIDLPEETLRHELLDQLTNFDTDSKAIKVDFDKNNLSFERDVTIQNPKYAGVTFETVKIAYVRHIPEDIYEAEKWLYELMYKNIQSYFLDEADFDTFVQEQSKVLLSHYPSLAIPDRKELIQKFAQRNDTFYQQAKLTTIDYLTY